MSEWIDVKQRMPKFEEKVLLLWQKTGHVEDGTVYESEDVPGEWYHVLFDGEILNDRPTHWQPYMDLPK